MNENLPDKSEFILYRTEAGKEKIEVKLAGDSVWLTQAAMAELFQTTPKNITIHMNALFQQKKS